MPENAPRRPRMPLTEDEAIRTIVGDLQRLGGYLRCRTCGHHKQLGAVNMKLKNGWPRCCGHTMEWITQRQVREGYLDDPEAWIAKEKARG